MRNLSKLLAIVILGTAFAAVSGTSYAQRIMSAEKEAALKAIIPHVADKDDERIIHQDTSTVFYTIREMPRAFQFAGGNGRVHTSFHWAGHNFSGDNNSPFFSASKPHGRGGNANIDFPWRMDVPGGTNRTENVESFKAFWLPKAQGGRQWPVVWFTERLRNPISGGGTDPAYRWVFPVGTKFYEFITQRSPEGYDYVFEIRKRTREEKEWAIEIYRPFPTATRLAAAIKSKEPEWQRQPALITLVKHLETPGTVRTATIEDKANRNKRAFFVRSGIDRIPPINNDDLVLKLLTETTFTYSNGEAWKAGNKGESSAFAPSFSGKGFHVVPSGYDGTFLGSTRQSCMRCHESTNVHARVFDRGRGWYGYVSGSDGIISWNPMEPRYIARNGNGNARVVFRTAWTQSGLIEKFRDNTRHPPSMYRQIKGLK